MEMNISGSCCPVGSYHQISIILWMIWNRVRGLYPEAVFPNYLVNERVAPSLQFGHGCMPGTVSCECFALRSRVVNRKTRISGDQSQ